MNSTLIMVINWNNTADSIECIESLLSQDTACTILSVDNASANDQIQKLRAYVATKQSSHDIQLVETGENGGTAGGFNAGVQWAIDNKYEFVGTLNADAVADPGWLSALSAELRDHREVGIATGLLLRRDGKTIDTSGDFYTTWGLPGPRNRDARREAAPTESGYVFGSSGGAFLARVAMFEDIGLFDRNYFMYYEDVDLSFRAQLAGYRVRYTPRAIAYHKLGASSSTVPGLAVYNTFKNLPMLLVKNVPLRLCMTIYPRFVLLYFLILASAIRKGSGGPALRGFLKSWTYLVHMFVERRKIQANRRVPAAYISSIILHDIPPEQTGMRRFRKIFTGRP